MLPRTSLGHRRSAPAPRPVPQTRPQPPQWQEAVSHAHSFAKIGIAAGRASARQFMARGIVPGKARPYRRHFRELLRTPELVEMVRVCYSGTAPAGKFRPSIRFLHPSAGEFQMTITAAHISRHRCSNCGGLDPDHATASQFHRSDLPDRHRSGRPRRAQDVAQPLISGSEITGSGVSRLARNPSKMV